MICTNPLSFPTEKRSRVELSCFSQTLVKQQLNFSAGEYNVFRARCRCPFLGMSSHVLHKHFWGYLWSTALLGQSELQLASPATAWAAVGVHLARRGLGGWHLVREAEAEVLKRACAVSACNSSPAHA